MTSHQTYGKREEDTIPVTKVMPGATTINVVPNVDQEFVHSMIKIAKIKTYVKSEDHLPCNVLDMPRREYEAVI
jgi:hypothetical protein